MNIISKSNITTNYIYNDLNNADFDIHESPDCTHLSEDSLYYINLVLFSTILL
jgi:hypothetical protein